MPKEMDDPRELDSGGIVGPADPHGRDDHLIDARHAILVEDLTVSMVTEGNRGRPLAALVIAGRINQTQDRTRVLCVLNADAVAAIMSELVGLLGRAGFGQEAYEALVERLAEMEAQGLLKPKEADGDDRDLLIRARTAAASARPEESVTYSKADLAELRGKCPCFHFEADPDLTEEDMDEVCACGHVLDEHDDQGECTVVLGDTVQ